MDSFGPEAIGIAAAIAALAGVIRGITGFGGAMVMTPPYALMLQPLVAVPVALLLEGLVAAPMLVQTRRMVRWRVVGPIIAATCLTAPLGGYVLQHADPQWLRRAIAVIVIVFSLLLLAGWRYEGKQRLGTSLGVGGVSGVMMGATSVGGPPVVLYLLAGPDRIENTRANLTFFVAVSSTVAIAALWARGALEPRAVSVAALAAPLYLAGVVAGNRLFARFTDQRFRRFALLLMAAVSAGVLMA